MIIHIRYAFDDKASDRLGLNIYTAGNLTLRFAPRGCALQGSIYSEAHPRIDLKALVCY